MHFEVPGSSQFLDAGRHFVTCTGLGLARIRSVISHQKDSGRSPFPVQRRHTLVRKCLQSVPYRPYRPYRGPCMCKYCLADVGVICRSLDALLGVSSTRSGKQAMLACRQISVLLFLDATMRRPCISSTLAQPRVELHQRSLLGSKSVCIASFFFQKGLLRTLGDTVSFENSRCLRPVVYLQGRPTTSARQQERYEPAEFGASAHLEIDKARSGTSCYHWPITSQTVGSLANGKAGMRLG